MEYNSYDSSKKILLSTIGIAVLIIAIVGVAFAFFNYTRTGTSNTIRVGRISFVTEQTLGNTIDLSNAFPISRSSAGTDTDNTGEVVISIEGDTDYTEGVEYLVTVTDVTNTINGKTIPISVIVTPNGTLGTSSDTYYTARTSTESSIYKVEAENIIENNGRIMVGYIAQNSTPGTASGIDGSISIVAYLDSDLIGISDTYYENAPTPTPTAPNDEYGTPASFGEGKVVLTTIEWNSLQSSGISFKVKVEANQGIWVEEPDNSTPSAYFAAVLAPTYSYNTNREQSDVTNCVSYLTNEGYDQFLQQGESLNDFCAGTGTLMGSDIAFWATDGNSTIMQLASANILTVRNTVTLVSYDNNGDNDVIMPSELPGYSYNSNRNSTDITNCVNYLTSRGYDQELEQGESLSDFCAGTGRIGYFENNTIYFATLYGFFSFEEITELHNLNILSLSTDSYPVTKIGYEAFANTQITTIELPDSIVDVSALGVRSFYNNTLTLVIVPDALYSSLNPYCNGSFDEWVFSPGILIVDKSDNNSCRTTNKYQL